MYLRGDDMRKCLIVVDFQNDFIDGTLGFDSAIEIKDKIIEKINQFKKNNNDIIDLLSINRGNYGQNKRSSYRR